MCVRVFMCEKNDTKKGKIKVSMETIWLCLIGNKILKRSEIRNREAGLTQPHECA